MKEVLHSKPWITDEDRAAVADVMRSGMLAQGEKCREFEAALGAWMGVDEGGVAVGSGSAAIVLALQALEIGEGDEVVLTSYNCPKVLEAVATVGATPVPCDIGEQWRLRPEDVESHLSARTRAIIVPHLLGIFADTVAFRRFGIPIIEDYAQALDAKGRRRIARSDIAIFSFHPTKLITTGEGGMALAADPALTRRMRAIRDGAASRDRGRLFSPLADLSAALGLSQLARYPTALERRRKIAAAYRHALQPVIPGGFADYPFEHSVFFRFPVKMPGGVEKYRPLFAQRTIRVSNGIDALLHRALGRPDEAFATSIALFTDTVSLPIYPALTPEEAQRCVQAATELFAGVGRASRAVSA